MFASKKPVHKFGIALTFRRRFMASLSRGFGHAETLCPRSPQLKHKLPIGLFFFSTSAAAASRSAESTIFSSHKRLSSCLAHFLRASGRGTENIGRKTGATHSSTFALLVTVRQSRFAGVASMLKPWYSTELWRRSVASFCLTSTPPLPDFFPSVKTQKRSSSSIVKWIFCMDTVDAAWL